MRVKAAKDGFYGARMQRAGTVFECAEGSFSARWMQRVEEPEPETAEAPKPPVSQEPVPIQKKRRGRKPKSQDSGASAPALSE